MSEGERSEFHEWYEKQEPQFDKKRVLEKYCQGAVTILKQECLVFPREYMQIGNLDLILKTITIASAYNKVLRKRFLQPDTICLTPTGGYTCNKYYSKKAKMWLVHMEGTDVVKIMHGRNDREYKVHELPHLILEGYCPETRGIYEFFGYYFHGHKCQPFRDVITTLCDTLAERYERTMLRLQPITRSIYLVNFQWNASLTNRVL